MLFFTKRIIITKHAKERYIERVAKEKISDRKVRELILKDFQIKSVRRKTPKDDDGYFKLWVFGARQYVCIETPKTVVIKTVIQMLPSDEQKIIDEIKEME